MFYVIFLYFCSFDGVPFILHDRSLHRTTNVAEVFPDHVDTDPSYFNISQLKMLNTGDWFLQVCTNKGKERSIYA